MVCCMTKPKIVNGRPSEPPTGDRRRTTWFFGMLLTPQVLLPMLIALTARLGAQLNVMGALMCFGFIALFGWAGFTEAEHNTLQDWLVYPILIPVLGMMIGMLAGWIRRVLGLPEARMPNLDDDHDRPISFSASDHFGGTMVWFLNWLGVILLVLLLPGLLINWLFPG